MKTDLTGESAAELESTKRFFRPFVIERLRFFAYGFLCLAFFTGIALLERHEINHSHPYKVNTGLAQFQRAKDSTAMGIIGLGGLLLGIVGTGIVVYQVVKCLIGPPRAPEAPDKAVLFYLRTCLLSDTFFRPLSVGSYICLLSSARREFGSYEGFQDYWRGVNKGIREKNGAFNMEHLQQYWVQKVSANESEATFNIKVKLVFF